MKSFCAVTVAALCLFGSASIAINAAEEKVEVKDKGNGEWKMKVKRKGDHDWVGTYDGREYSLRGDALATIHDEGDYTVYGTLAPDNTFVTTTKITRIETK